MAFQDDSGAERSRAIRPSEDLFARLAGIEMGESVRFHKMDVPEQSPPLSYLDAARLCEAHGCPYLLYGYIKRTSYSLYGEVKLLARENKEVVTAFVAGDDDGHYEKLVDDLTAKITAYIRNDMGIGPPRREETVRNVLTLPVMLGYWAPVNGGWASSLSGLVCADISIRFVPAIPLFHVLNRGGYLAFGLDAEYGLATNQPGLEPFFLHAVRVRLPVEVFLELENGHSFGIGAGPLLEIDTMIQSRLYSSTVTESAITRGRLSRSPTGTLCPSPFLSVLPVLSMSHSMRARS